MNMINKKICGLAAVVLILLVHAQKEDVCSRTEEEAKLPGTLRQEDLPDIQYFGDFDQTDTVHLLGKANQTVRTGSISQIYKVDSAAPASTALLPELVDRASIHDVLQILRSYGNYDEDPDTVYGMPTYELFVDSRDLGECEWKVLDRVDKEQGDLVRTQLRAILDPILEKGNEHPL